MKTLLHERHPDIDDSIIRNCKKYTNLDVNGNVLECLQRNSLDEDFVDVTEIEQERVRLLNYEKELAKLKRKADELKEKEPDYAKKSSASC